MAIRIRAEDKWFSLYIRARDNWTCQRCGRRYEPYVEGGNNRHLSGLHNAHCFGRGSHQTRWDEDNCCALCYGCHSYLDGHPVEKTEFFKDLLGEETFENTRKASHEPYRGWKKDAPEISRHYRNKFREINK